MVTVVVLLGPPGSGKSVIGEELGRRGFRWRDWESVILQRWESRANFLTEKAQALPALHAEILEWIESEPSAAVIETTGLSDAPLLATLDTTGRAVVVRLDVSEEEAGRRVAARQQGRHLSDDREDNRRVWRAFREHAASRDVDLIIDTERHSIESAVATIERHLRRFERSAQSR